MICCDICEHFAASAARREYCGGQRREVAEAGAVTDIERSLGTDAVLHLREVGAIAEPVQIALTESTTRAEENWNEQVSVK